MASGCSKMYQCFRLSVLYSRSLETSVLLYRIPGRLSAGEKLLPDSLALVGKRRKDVKGVLTISCSSSESRVFGIPWLIIQLLKKMLATFVNVIFIVGIAFVCLVNLSVRMTRNCLPTLVLESGLKIPMATNSRGPPGWNNFSLLWCLNLVLMRGLSVLLRITVYTSATTWRPFNSRLNESYILLSPGWLLIMKRFARFSILVRNEVSTSFRIGPSIAAFLTSTLSLS